MVDGDIGGTLSSGEVSAALPTRPIPVAHPSISPRALHSQLNADLDEKESYQRGYANHHHPSLSSVARSSRTVDSIDVEKQALKSSFMQDERASHRSSLPHSDQGISHVEAHLYQVGAGLDSSPRHQIIHESYDSDEDDEREPELDLSPKCVKLLLFFAGPLPFISFALTTWTLIITLILTLIHPIRLVFTRRRSFSDILLSVLAPTLNLHLRLVYHGRIAAENLRFFPTLLALIGSSVLSIGFASWAAVLAVYWVLAVIIGNPDGLDGRSEGREMVLTTRKKWVSWLQISMRS